LARAGKSIVVLDNAQLIGQLTPLALTTLRWPAEMLARLSKMGVHTVGHALRLPRAGFARRFGAAALAELDRLKGQDPGPRTRFQPRERFRRRMELLYELENQTALSGVLEPLLHELEKFLRTRQCGITQIECVLYHRHADATRCVLRLSAPEANAERLGKLLAERLATIALTEPVRACELRCGRLAARVFASEGLWQRGEHGGGAGAESSQLLEQLRARLGAEAVYGLQLLADHRPEKAWRVCEPGHITTSDSWPLSPTRRPFWLLNVPQPLREHEGRPQLQGPLRLLGNPERIETGWWDGAPVARDYYTAEDLRGVRLWIFRERSPRHQWFLQGVFG